MSIVTINAQSDYDHLQGSDVTRIGCRVSY
jgi:hypothetical protein